MMKTSPLQDPLPCDSDVMSEIVESLNGPDEPSLALINDALIRWPQDHRLWFLRAAVYASQQRNAEARVDFAQTLVLAPQFDVARFMLGFLELMDQRIEAATLSWAPLDRLPETDPLRIFKSGMLDLSENRFKQALDQLKRGLALNRAHPAINTYIEASVAQIEAMPAAERHEAALAEETLDSHLLLSGYRTSPTRH